MPAALYSDFYKNCVLCPRRCGADRLAGERGFCGETAALRLSFAGLHRGEEPPVTGAGGSGTIFVFGCNLGCAFCQNFQISKSAAADAESGVFWRTVETKEFAEICLALEEKGAENINIVTGSHAAPAIALGIAEARTRGLCIPVLWNSSGYEGAGSLEAVKDFVDVYLPDLKTLDTSFAARFFNAPDYPENAAKAILKMIEYKAPRFGPGRAGAFSGGPGHSRENAPAEIMQTGVMVRHLVIPGFTDNTRRVLEWFARNCSGRALLSLMTQYTPVNVPAASGQGPAAAIPERYLSEDEYGAVLSMLEEFGIDDGFCQELVTGSDWLPDFNRPNPFSSELSVPVWRPVARA